MMIIIKRLLYSSSINESPKKVAQLLIYQERKTKTKHDSNNQTLCKIQTKQGRATVVCHSSQRTEYYKKNSNDSKK